jgi:hypothetical protein
MSRAMRRVALALLLIAVALPACKRGRSTTSSNQAKSANSAPGQTSPVARNDPAPPTSPANPTPGGPGPAPPPVSSWQGGDVTPGKTRGTATIGVDGTALDDFILYSFTLDNGTFRLDGQGIALVGRGSRAWEGTIGKPVAILPEVAGVGASELDLPQVGMMKITGGQIVIDESEKNTPPRVRGRLAIIVEGPDGKVSFSGKFEVGIVVK